MAIDRCQFVFQLQHDQDRHAKGQLANAAQSRLPHASSLRGRHPHTGDDKPNLGCKNEVLNILFSQNVFLFERETRPAILLCFIHPNTN